MSDTTDRAFEVISEHYQKRSGFAIAQALDAAGLLATPEHDADQRQIGADEITQLIKASAIGARARGDRDRERTLLDLLALIEQSQR